ncbi:MAG: HEPN domain-containing protein [Anaerolineales bacterium]|nr:MAG: HEPN domain-containing protein [Anaerolineales bacterium]
MKESTQQLLFNAEETLNAAEVLIKEEYLRDAVNRAYYAVFYTAESLLNEKDLRFKKHGTVHGSFAQHFVKTGIFDAKYHKLLVTAFGRRMLGDYDEVTRFSSEEVREIIDQAWGFLKAAKEYLAK